MNLLLIPAVILAVALFILLGPARKIGQPTPQERRQDPAPPPPLALPVAGRLTTYQPAPPAYGDPYPEPGTDTGWLFDVHHLTAYGAAVEREVRRAADEADRLYRLGQQHIGELLPAEIPETGTAADAGSYDGR